MVNSTKVQKPKPIGMESSKQDKQVNKPAIQITLGHQGRVKQTKIDQKQSNSQKSKRNSPQ